ncbi:MAG: hypothetical protein N3D10_03750 [Candidatus Micrarchaeota archaeon]|nr:hypothetical protein [Candidatus Micrarchaeota archaeon]
MEKFKQLEQKENKNRKANNSKKFFMKMFIVSSLALSTLNSGCSSFIETMKRWDRKLSEIFYGPPKKSLNEVVVEPYKQIVIQIGELNKRILQMQTTAVERSLSKEEKEEIVQIHIKLQNILNFLIAGYLWIGLEITNLEREIIAIENSIKMEEKKKTMYNIKPNYLIILRLEDEKKAAEKSKDKLIQEKGRYRQQIDIVKQYLKTIEEIYEKYEISNKNYNNKKLEQNEIIISIDNYVSKRRERIIGK